jgi:hypothetical protein
MPLPLHIFEIRYRKMVADALEGERTIGMTLLKPGWEEDYAGRPPVYAVGCAGRIQQHERLEQGPFNIVLRGATRFRILEEHEGEPYRLAAVAPLADSAGDAAALEVLRRRILATIARATDGPTALVLQGELPHELFVNGLCQSLNLLAVEKQSLLDCDTLEARCARLLELLDFRLLERAVGRTSGIH